MISSICQLSKKGRLLLFCLCILLSCNKDDLAGPEQAQKLQTETLEQISLKIFNDPLYQQKLAYELKMSQLDLSLSNSQLKAQLNNLKVLLERKHYSKEDVDYIAAELGFNSAKEYFSYLNLAPQLFQKYSIGHFSVEEKQELSRLLTNKQLENLDSVNSLNPECEKCAWDYQSCVLGYQTGYFVQYSTNYTSQPVWSVTYNYEYFYEYAYGEAPNDVTWSENHTYDIDTQVTYSLSYSTSTKNCRRDYDQCLISCRL